MAYMPTLVDPPTCKLPLLVVVSIASQFKLSFAIAVVVHCKGVLGLVLVNFTNCSAGLPCPITAWNCSKLVESERFGLVASGLPARPTWILRVALWLDWLFCASIVCVPADHVEAMGIVTSNVPWLVAMIASCLPFEPLMVEVASSKKIMGAPASNPLPRRCSA